VARKPEVFTDHTDQYLEKMETKKPRFTKKTIGLSILVLLIAIQFFRIDKTNPPAGSSADFMALTHPPASIAGLLKESCYDCHSNTTSYPWYTNVAPVSWWIKSHIREGRRHLNFSNWSNYSEAKADHKLEECVEMVEEGEMPMISYTLLHPKGKLSKEQQAQLAAWFNSLRTHVSDKPEEK
jgi:hypothetical protein